MDTQALRVTYFVDDEHVPPWCDDIRSFLSAALGLRFEMRYFGEACWYMTTAEDLAHTLVPYYPDLTVCLDGMLDGEEVDSRLATYRLCRDQRRVQIEFGPGSEIDDAARGTSNRDRRSGRGR